MNKFNLDRSPVFNFEWQWPLNFSVLESGYYWKILSKHLFFLLKTCKNVFPQIWLTLFLTVHLYSILSDSDLWIFLCLKVGTTERYWENSVFSVKNLQACVSSSLINFNLDRWPVFNFELKWPLNIFCVGKWALLKDTE